MKIIPGLTLLAATMKKKMSFRLLIAPIYPHVFAPLRNEVLKAFLLPTQTMNAFIMRKGRRLRGK